MIFRSLGAANRIEARRLLVGTDDAFRELSRSEFAAWLMLQGLDDGVLRRGASAVAREIRVPARSLTRWLAALDARGYVELRRGPRGSRTEITIARRAVML